MHGVMLDRHLQAEKVRIAETAQIALKGFTGAKEAEISYNFTFLGCQSSLNFQDLRTKGLTRLQPPPLGFCDCGLFLPNQSLIWLLHESYREVSMNRSYAQ